MKIETIKAKQNPLLHRKEYLLRLEHPSKATPSRHQLMELLATQLKLEKEKIKIVYVRSEKGKPSSLVKLYHETS